MLIRSLELLGFAALTYSCFANDRDIQMILPKVNPAVAHKTPPFFTEREKSADRGRRNECQRNGNKIDAPDLLRFVIESN